MTAPFPPPPSSASTPNPPIQTLVLDLIRSGLLVAGAIGIYHGGISDSILQVIAGGIVGGATAAWALWVRFADYRHAHRVAEVNAARQAGSTPVQPLRSMLAR